MRKVKFISYDSGNRTERFGFFHQWGSACAEDGGGNLVWSIAICEEEGTGKIFDPQVSDVQFLEPQTK